MRVALSAGRGVWKALGKACRKQVTASHPASVGWALGWARPGKNLMTRSVHAVVHWCSGLPDAYSASLEAWRVACVTCGGRACGLQSRVLLALLLLVGVWSPATPCHCGAWVMMVTPIAWWAGRGVVSLARLEPSGKSPLLLSWESLTVNTWPTFSWDRQHLASDLALATSQVAFACSRGLPLPAAPGCSMHSRLLLGSLGFACLLPPAAGPWR